MGTFTSQKWTRTTQITKRYGCFYISIYIYKTERSVIWLVLVGVWETFSTEYLLIRKKKKERIKVKRTEKEERRLTCTHTSTYLYRLLCKLLEIKLLANIVKLPSKQRRSSEEAVSRMRNKNCLDLYLASGARDLTSWPLSFHSRTTVSPFTRGHSFFGY